MNPLLNNIFARLFTIFGLTIVVTLICIISRRLQGEEYVRKVKKADKIGMTYMPRADVTGRDESPRRVTYKDVERNPMLYAPRFIPLYDPSKPV